MSASAPIVAEPEPKHSGFWDKWIGKQVVIQTKGKVVITGTLKRFANCFLEIEQPIVHGIKYKVQPPVVMVDRNFISHFHETAPLESAE